MSIQNSLKRLFKKFPPFDCSQISALCQDGPIYAAELDLKSWATLRDQSQALEVLDAVTHATLDNPTPTPCREVAVPSPTARRGTDTERCKCRIRFCIPWYPCGLK